MSQFDSELFSPAFFKKLESLRIIIKKRLDLLKHGVSPARNPTGNSDFKGYRRYSPGDDLRYLDWHSYARSETLLLKEFAGESRLSLLILIDASASMSIGFPKKFYLALQIAAALAYLGTHSGHAVRVGFLHRGGIEYSHIACATNHLHSILQFLSWREPEGTISLDQAMMPLVSLNQTSLIFLCSDMLMAQNSKPLLEKLTLKRHEMCIFHLMADQEVNPDFIGPIELEDSETGEKIALVVDEAVKKAYRQKIQNFRENWYAFCNRHNLHYGFFTNRSAIEEIVYEGLCGWML